MLSTPSTPTDLVTSINRALLATADARQRPEQTTLADLLLRWLQPRAAQYAVSSLASVLLFATVFVALRPHMIALHEAAVAIDEAGEGRSAQDVRAMGYDITQPISSASYAALRTPFNTESPSLNPSGALATLAWSSGGQNRGRGDADDMVVVADVFSNGVASLADVMQAPRDRRMLDELQKALRQDAAFVPASLDGRPGTMRVVFSVQRVDVRDRSF
jgi:hypothetical protein